MNERAFRSPFESLVQRTASTSYFPFTLHQFSPSAHLISIYPIDILLSPVLSPIFSNCTPATNGLFRHLFANTPLPTLHACFYGMYSYNIADCFERRGLRGTYTPSLHCLLYSGYTQLMKNEIKMKISGGVIRCSAKQLLTHDIRIMILHTAYHPSLRYCFDNGFISVHHGDTTLPKNMAYISLHLARGRSIGMSNLRLCGRSIL